MRHSLLGNVLKNEPGHAPRQVSEHMRWHMFEHVLRQVPSRHQVFEVWDLAVPVPWDLAVPVLGDLVVPLPGDLAVRRCHMLTIIEAVDPTKNMYSYHRDNKPTI